MMTNCLSEAHPNPAGRTRDPRPTGIRGAMRLLALSGAWWCLAAPASLHAQTAGVFLPNYNRVPVGETGALEGGAFIARVSDASAGWYNPAGLANAESDTISGNAVVYERLAVKSGGEEDTTTINEIPSFVGGLKRYGRLALGISITAPVSVNSTTDKRREGVSVVDPSGNSTQLITVTESSLISSRFTLISPALSAALRVAPFLRVGAAVRIYQTEMSLHSTSERYESETTFNNYEASTNQLLTGSALLYSGELGIQVEVTERIVVGVLYRARSTSIQSSGRFRFSAYRAVDFDSDGDGDFDSRLTVTGHTLQEKERFSYIVPRELSYGIAYVGSRVEVELDRRCYEALDRYDLFGGGQVIRFQGGTPMANITFDETIAPMPYDMREVCNLSGGAKWKPIDSVHLHLGAFADHSPVAASSEAFPNRLDGVGITAGVSLLGRNSSVSFGIVDYSGDPISDSTESAVGIRAQSLIIAASYFF